MLNEINMGEIVANTDRRFGSADTYIPAIVTDLEENEHVALFTPAEIQSAIARGDVNPEDTARIHERASATAGKIVLLNIAAAVGMFLLGALSVWVAT